MQKNSWIIGLMLVVVFSACREKSQHPMQGMSNAEMKELLMESSRHSAHLEEEKINHFVEEQDGTFKKSGTGLRYQIFPGTATPCDSILPEQRVFLNYSVELLDGTPCYSSLLSGPRSFVVEHDDVESGLHEGIQYLCVGDSAEMVLPSHLAHGLTGDQRKIPSNTPIVYRVKVISVE